MKIVPVVMIAALLGACGGEGEVRSTTPNGVPKRFQALGTEPFWNLDVNGGSASYSTPDIARQDATSVQRSANADGAMITGMLGGAPFTLTVRRGSCSDGMSDTTYPFGAELRLGGRTLQGCARAR